jgi:RNA polymerase sigma-70 factor (ECF subfamily)
MSTRINRKEMSYYTNNKKLSEIPMQEVLFSDCYIQHWHDIYNYLLGRTRNSDSALDLTQNVFLKFWTLKDQYPVISDAKAYLRQMALNAFLDACRKDKNSVAYLKAAKDNIEVSKTLTEQMLDDRELQRRFQQAVLDLPEQRRIVFVLSKMEGWPRGKIAQVLGISQLTVRATLQNAMRQVREKCSPTQTFQLTKTK